MKEDQVLDFILDGEIRIFCTSIIVRGLLLLFSSYYYIFLGKFNPSHRRRTGKGGKGEVPLAELLMGGTPPPLKIWPLKKYAQGWGQKACPEWGKIGQVGEKFLRARMPK